MIINRLCLENFGLYFGKQEFDLRPINNKNIILIGGKNGNGKTTFFEAIQLCLYGHQILKKRHNNSIYDDYLKDKIHYNSKLKKQLNSAMVEIEFQHSYLNNIDVYIVKRSWNIIQNKVYEEIDIKKNGEILAELESEQWQDFINDLIPIGLSQLCFFDGEKIQKLAKDKKNNVQFADSFKALLGLDLIEKLESDLEIYLVKQLKTLGEDNVKTKIELIQKEEKQYELQLDTLYQKRAQIKTKIDKQFVDIERQEQLIFKEGGNFGKNRDESKLNKVKLNTQMNELEDKLREFCSDLLPFAFASKLNKKLKETIIKEESSRNDKITLENLKNKKELIKTELKNISKKEQNDNILIFNEVFDSIDTVFSKDIKSINFIHNLSIEDANQLKFQIEEAMTKCPIKLYELVKKHNVLSKQIHIIEKELNFAPDQAIIEPYLKKINELHQELGSFQEQLRIEDEKINQTKLMYDKIIMNLKKLIDNLKDKNNTSNRLNMTKKVQETLFEYHSTLKKQKINEFSKLFIESYNYIAHKKDIFEKIEINSQDYSVMLYKQGSKKILKSQLSEGEKQIYAISILWTLTKLSRRPLPFIIDTPLARLDVSHRDNLVFNFFPKSSHQLIILSTDTEIDKRYMDELNPYIAHKYNLIYDDEKTIIKKGYFWRDDDDDNI